MSLVPQGPTSTWPGWGRAINPLVLTPQRVLPCSTVGPGIIPPHIRLHSSTSTSPAAVRPLWRGTTTTRAESTPGRRQCRCGVLHWQQRPLGTHVGPRSTWELRHRGGVPMAKGTDQTWAPPGLSWSRCWGQQGVGGPCPGMLQQMLLCPAGDEQPVPSCLLPAQPHGERLNLARSSTAELASASGKSNPAPQEETKQRLLCTSKKKPKSYLNKTALSLFWALQQALLLGGFLCPAPP